jgi:hypothetical protein
VGYASVVIRSIVTNYKRKMRLLRVAWRSRDRDCYWPEYVPASDEKHGYRQESKQTRASDSTYSFCWEKPHQWLWLRKFLF